MYPIMLQEYQPSSSLSLILPLSLHREMALYLVEANARHLPSLPGGSDYDPMSSTFRKVIYNYTCTVVLYSGIHVHVHVHVICIICEISCHMIVMIVEWMKSK